MSRKPAVARSATRPAARRQQAGKSALASPSPLLSPSPLGLSPEPPPHLLQYVNKPLTATGIWERGPLLGPLCFWAALAFSCHLPSAMLAALGLPKRFVIQCTVHAVYIGRALAEVPALCSTPLVRHPASQRQLAAVHDALQASAAALGLAPAAGRGGGPGSGPKPGVECHATLSTAMLVLGYAVPLALSAALEWHSYAEWRATGGTSPVTGAPPSRFVAAPVRRGRRHGLLRELLCALQGAALRALLAAGAGALMLAVWLGCAAAYSRGAVG